MSADLFAAFDSGADGQHVTAKPGQDHSVSTDSSVRGPVHQASQVQIVLSAASEGASRDHVEDDDGDFGDFEGTDPWQDEATKSAPTETTKSPPIRLAPPQKAAITHNFSNETDQGACQTTVVETASRQQRRAADTDVLFDADDSYNEWDTSGEPEDDDFGDFAEPSPRLPPKDYPPRINRPSQAPVVSPDKHISPPKPPVQPSVDLLSLHEWDEAPPPASRPKTTLSRPPKPSTSSAKALHTTPTTDTPPPADWADFEVTSPSTSSTTASAQQIPTATSITNPAQPSTPDLPTYPFLSLAPPSTLGPSNIPPPSILLTLFPPLFKQCTHSLARLSRQLHSTSLSTFLPQHIRLCHIFTHMLAGRKLRWRRDTRLAQAMSIGASGGRGMKLAGLDRSEVQREDAAALECVGAYRTHAGPLRSAVGALLAGGGSRGAGHGSEDLDLLGSTTTIPAPGSGRRAGARSTLVVPEVAPTMPVRAAAAAEGAITSAKACGLCGLKREERVTKVDVGVEDSFGEWWVEGMGWHAECWRFWEGFRGELAGRA